MAAFVTVESATGYNAFNHLSSVTSILTAGPQPFTLNDAVNVRGGRLRAYGSSQDPISMSALMVMLIPLAIYLARAKRAGHDGGGRRASSPWERSLRSRAPES